MTNTSRHPACLMALAVRRIAASATLTALTWEKAAGPIRRASEQVGDEAANPPASPWPGIFMLAVFFIGRLSVGFRLEKTAYRYASVTLTIIVLIPRTNPAWILGLHRFIEVSVGIIVALIVVAVWPERPAIAAKNAAV